MRLARYRTATGPVLGQVLDGQVLDLVASGPGTGADLVESFLADVRCEPRVRELAGVELLAPVARPQKIICVGLNYLDHCRETGTDPPAVPVLFAKFPNALVGPGAAVRFPDSLHKVDFEGELALVIGSRCYRVDRSSALDHVFGYTIANDVSERQLQFESSQWTYGKTPDTFLPLGPCLVTPDEIQDPQSLAIRTWVNETQYQDSSTAEMIFPIAELISHISRLITLEPGDLILTGTPWGVGFARTPPVFLQDGDTVTIEIDALGLLSNLVCVEA